MHTQSTNLTCACTPDHEWRLQGLVRTPKGQVDYYQCQRCLAPRQDVRRPATQRDPQR